VPLTRHRRSVPTGGAPVAGCRAPGVVLALVVALFGLLGGLVALSASAGPVAAAGSCAGPLADGQIRVVMVIDPGQFGPRGPMATCLVVAAGTSGSKILAQRASELGLPAPRYAGSGLLCGLDGFPATACPVNNGSSYDFWAYFNGAGGSWSFGHDNPFVRRMVDGEIMGWRYTTGSNEGNAQQPRIAPSSSLFPPLTPAATAPPAPAPTAPPAPGGSSGAPGSGGVGATDGAGGTDPTAAADPGATTVPADATEGAADSSTTTADGVGSTDAATQAEELAAAPASSSSDTGRWIGLAVAVAAVGALALGAVARTRARRS
jgi:hypothetical protein